MCFGGSQPQAPTVKYKGPSKDEIKAQQQALDKYKQQIDTQQSNFQSQLQQQIDDANQQTAALQTQYADDLKAAEASGAEAIGGAEADAAAAAAGAGAESAAQQVGALTVTTSESEPEQAQTTEKIDKKKKPKANLKISTAGTASQAGSGLNIGV